jgi:ParB/RepB/Spo0J family partition protein
MTEKMKIDYLPIDTLKANSHNPNTQKDITFNKLVENIEEIGFVEPVMVRPLDNGDYEIVSGHHRVEAAKIIGYEELPCIVQNDFDEDQAKFQLVRMNVLRGELDPQRFTDLFNEMAEKYGEELTKDMMAMVDQKAFEKLYIDVRSELPKDLQKKLDETKKEIKDVDGLSRILNQMFSSYGDTLDYNFMVFSYGNKQHYWIQMDKDMNKTMGKLHDLAMRGKVDINNLFGQIFTSEEAKKQVKAWDEEYPDIVTTDDEVNFE